jgi:hypothetical protein
MLPFGIVSGIIDMLCIWKVFGSGVSFGGEQNFAI